VPAIKLDNENIGGHYTPLHTITGTFNSVIQRPLLTYLSILPYCCKGNKHHSIVANTKTNTSLGWGQANNIS